MSRDRARAPDRDWGFLDWAVLVLGCALLCGGKKGRILALAILIVGAALSVLGAYDIGHDDARRAAPIAAALRGAP